MKLNILTIFFALGILSILIFGKQADAYCYDNDVFAKTGKTNYLHQQSIYGIDCFTGRFEPPSHLSKTNEDYWSFDTFRILYLLTIVCLVLDILLLSRKKMGWAIVVALLAFVNCAVCAIYFDGFHNYYATAAERFHWSGVHSFTFDVRYYWLLSNLLFWVIFVTFILMQIAPFFKKMVDGKAKKGSHLLDN